MAFQRTAFQPTAFPTPVSSPTWVSPATGSIISPSTPVVWTSLAAGSDAHFHLEFDRSSDFTTGALVSRRSFLDPGFEYWDGAAWAELPTGGLPAAATGADVRYTPTDQPTGTWYRRVRQSA